MQVFNNMASSGLGTRKFTPYRANTRESTSYMTEIDCHPARSESRMVTCGPVRQRVARDSCLVLSTED